MWTFVLPPPGCARALRPRDPFFGPGGLLIGPDDSAIDGVQVSIEPAGGIGLLLERVKEAPEDAGSQPAREATSDGAPWAIALGQIPPGRPGAQNPQHTVKDAAMTDRRSSSLRFWERSKGWSHSHWAWGKSPRFIAHGNIPSESNLQAHPRQEGLEGLVTFQAGNAEALPFRTTPSMSCCRPP
jgi:hypothetical protein